MSSSDNDNINNKTIVKTLYLIRHAESEENRRMAVLQTICVGLLSRGSIPSSQDVATAASLCNISAQVDSDVSDTGRQQIIQLATQWEQTGIDIPLVVHSPLRRAKLTCHGMLMNSHQRNLHQRNSATPRIVELDCLTEKTPMEWIPGFFYTLQHRIDQFQGWLQNQEESKIAIVGHSQYFKTMLGIDFKFGNCDVWQVQYSYCLSSSSSSNNHETDADCIMEPGWHGLKKVFSYQQSIS
jgi:phosphohistidine phosphatase SixA